MDDSKKSKKGRKKKKIYRSLNIVVKVNNGKGKGNFDSRRGLRITGSGRHDMIDATAIIILERCIH